MKVYVCSSWRNEHYDGIVATIRDYAHEVWDWRKPPTGGNGFHWSDCDPRLSPSPSRMTVSVDAWRQLLAHPIAQKSFASDLAGMHWCDVGVLLHPCGCSAHLEAGWLAGQGKKVHVLALEAVEPDLMVLALRGGIHDNLAALLEALVQP